MDFICLEKKLVIEFDGGGHARQVEADALRTAWLRSQGCRVLRFWNNQVFRETDAVLATIAEKLLLQFPATHPSPARGRVRRAGGAHPRHG